MRTHRYTLIITWHETPNIDLEYRNTVPVKD